MSNDPNRPISTRDMAFGANDYRMPVHHQKITSSRALNTENLFYQAIQLELK